jgi:hypothetical protein
MARGSLTIGGNASVAIGPLGRTGEASGALNSNGKVAAMSVLLLLSSYSSFLMPFQVQLLKIAWTFRRHLS